MADPARPSHVYLVLLVMPLFFSSNMVLGRATIDVAEPWTLAFLRWSIACLIILPFVGMDLWRQRQHIIAHSSVFLILSILGMWICGAGVYYALKFTTATNGTLIYTSSPVMILLLEAIFFGRPIGLRECAGVFCATVGIFVIVLQGSLDALIALKFNIGDVIFIITAASWAVYSVVLKRPAVTALSNTTTFGAIALTGAVTLVPFALFETAHSGFLLRSNDGWLAVIALGLFPSVLAFTSFQYGVRIVGPAVTGIFMYLLPPYGVALAAFFLAETIDWYHYAGCALVMSGVALATFQPSYPTRRQT